MTAKIGTGDGSVIDGAENKVSTSTVLHSWFDDDLRIPLEAGISHVFLLHGDINGLVLNPDRDEEPDRSYIPVKNFLEKVFENGEVVVFYNIASGIRFLNKDMEKKFRTVTGLDADNSSRGNPIADARASLAVKRGIPKEPELALPLIEKALKKCKKVALVINSIHFIAPATSGGISLLPPERANVERIKNWIQDEAIKANGNTIILLTDYSSKVSNEIKQAGSGLSIVFIPKPNKEERRDFIRLLVERSLSYAKLAVRLESINKETAKQEASPKKLPKLLQEAEAVKKEMRSYSVTFPMPENFDINMFAHTTQGMSFRQIFDIFLHAKKIGKPVSLDIVKLKKGEILNNEYGEIMEIVEPRRGLEDIGGLEHVKKELNNILDAIRKGESRLVPMGVTLMGPPGTGKTATVEALAKEAGFNFVRIRNVRSMWLGESESRQEKLIHGLRSLAPVIVMNDEADLTDASRDAPKGDSGVSERLMKMWMEFLSDPKIRGQVIVISCTNRPDRIDPALKRSGRSDERILLPMPSLKEIPDIFMVMFKRYEIPTDIKDFTSHALTVEGYSGADIEKISLNSLKFAFEQGKNSVTDEILRNAIEDFIPSASQAEIDRMTVLGILECSSRRLLPKNIKEIVSAIKRRNLVENLPEIMNQIMSRNILDAS